MSVCVCVFLNVLYSDQWALWCIQLERLYHQRVLDNLNALQEQWGNMFIKQIYMITTNIQLK